MYEFISIAVAISKIFTSVSQLEYIALRFIKE